MSGTSLDGVDVAMLRTDGEQIFEFGPTAFRPHSEAERFQLRRALGQWPDGPAVATAAEVVEAAHIEALAQLRGFDVVGFHGQTLAHDPANARTHQAGDGVTLAQKVGVPVVWDFRTNDVKLGGQGAPLSPIYHYALAQKADMNGRVGFLNLGGVANITVVDISRAPEDGILAFDTGPANAPIDDLVLAKTGARFDKDGALAMAGTVDKKIVGQVLELPYFAQAAPKSLDRDDFGAVLKTLSQDTVEHGAATLVSVIAQTVAHGIKDLGVDTVFVTGGGRRNPAIMSALEDTLRCAVHDIDTIGFDGDMLEAQAFAFLAARVMAGLPTSFPKTTGAPYAIGGGQISQPN